MGTLINNDEQLRVSLVDLSGETNIAYTPLATMYLKASVAADERLRHRVEVRLFNFVQAHTTAEMVSDLTAWSPNVIGMSCQGWNYRQLAATFETLRQFLPECFILLGGNHVTGRAGRILPAQPAVDAIVNGEGEYTFADLLTALLDGAPLSDVAGISLRDAQGCVMATPERPRTRSMTEVPSPYALDVDYRAFDIALLETNRGCPYGCAFCYWGGRVAQKIARGELGRVREELDVIGRSGVEILFLCDANFGLLPQDVEVARLVVEARRRYGTPVEFNVNWAKNHAERVGEIIDILEGGGVRTAKTLPLQTLSLSALRMAGRSERGRRETIELARRLVCEGGDVYCELIFGMPGESLADFKSNYDALYRDFPYLRIHPLWILPNTEYDRRRDDFGLRTISPDPLSDYEAVVSHSTMTMADMRDGLAMLLAHSMLSLLGTARLSLRMLSSYDGRSVAASLVSFEQFLARRRDPLGEGLYELFERIRRSCYFERGLRDRKRQLLYASREATHALVSEFIDEQGIPAGLEGAVPEMLRLEAALLPRSDLHGQGFEREVHDFAFEPVELSRRLFVDDDWPEWLESQHGRNRVEISHKAGLGALRGRNCDLTGSWNGRVVGVEPAATVPAA